MERSFQKVLVCKGRYASDSSMEERAVTNGSQLRISPNCVVFKNPSVSEVCAQNPCLPFSDGAGLQAL